MNYCGIEAGKDPGLGPEKSGLKAIFWTQIRRTLESISKICTRFIFKSTHIRGKYV